MKPAFHDRQDTRAKPVSESIATSASKYRDESTTITGTQPAVPVDVSPGVYVTGTNIPAAVFVGTISGTTLTVRRPRRPIRLATWPRRRTKPSTRRSVVASARAGRSLPEAGRRALRRLPRKSVGLAVNMRMSFRCPISRRGQS
jgi:hypothetical protein